MDASALPKYRPDTTRKTNSNATKNTIAQPQPLVKQAASTPELKPKPLNHYLLKKTENTNTNTKEILTNFYEFVGHNISTGIHQAYFKEKYLHYCYERNINHVTKAVCHILSLDVFLEGNTEEKVRTCECLMNANPPADNLEGDCLTNYCRWNFLYSSTCSYLKSLPTLSKAISCCEPFKTFPAEYLWLFFIDHKDVFMGYLAYEAEVGYIYSMMKGAYAVIAKNSHEKKLSLKYLSTLWNSFSQSTFCYDKNQRMSDTKSTGNHVTHIYKGYCTKEGTKETGYFFQQEDLNDCYVIQNALNSPYGETDEESVELFLIGASNYSKRLSKAKQLLANYEQNIKTLDTSKSDYADKVILEIASLCKHVLLLHLFHDGNGRLTTLILMKELIRHGLSPSLIETPLIFEGHTVVELVEKIKEGQQLFARCTEAPESVRAEIIQKNGGLQWPKYDAITPSLTPSPTIKPHIVTPLLFRHVHGLVRGFDQRIGVSFVVRIKCDADASAHHALASGELVW